MSRAGKRCNASGNQGSGQSPVVHDFLHELRRRTSRRHAEAIAPQIGQLDRTGFLFVFFFAESFLRSCRLSASNTPSNRGVRGGGRPYVLSRRLSRPPIRRDTDRNLRCRIVRPSSASSGPVTPHCFAGCSTPSVRSSRTWRPTPARSPDRPISKDCFAAITSSPWLPFRTVP